MTLATRNIFFGIVTLVVKAGSFYIYGKLTYVQLERPTLSIPQNCVLNFGKKIIFSNGRKQEISLKCKCSCNADTFLPDKCTLLFPHIFLLHPQPFQS